MKSNYPYRIDEANGIVYAWFTKMEYRGGAVTSDLEPRLNLFEDKYYDIYQKVGAVKMYKKFGFVPVSEKMEKWNIERGSINNSVYRSGTYSL